MKRATLILLTAALAMTPAAAQGRKKHHWLWATVNICDTKRHPDTLGVRARMPGNRTKGRMYVRFTAEYHSKSGWRRVKGARTPWKFVGSSLKYWAESGHSFRFDRRAQAASFATRGYAEFQWRARRPHRRGWRVVRRTHRLTRGGHHGTLDADPKDFSAAHCRISTAAK
jgi:hypothetical protein